MGLLQVWSEGQHLVTAVCPPLLLAWVRGRVQGQAMPWGWLQGGLALNHDFYHPGRGPSAGAREDRVSEHFFTIPITSADPPTQVPLLVAALSPLRSSCSPDLPVLPERASPAPGAAYSLPFSKASAFLCPTVFCTPSFGTAGLAGFVSALLS